MRTNIEIDDALLRKAMELIPKTTKKAVVEEALMVTVKLYPQRQALRKLRGIGWEAVLHAMRQSHFPDWDKSEGVRAQGYEAARRLSMPGRK